MTEKVLVGERVHPIPPHRCAQRVKAGRSSTSSDKGKKGKNCKTWPLKRYILTNPKARKRKDYEELFKRFSEGV
jgi:hypothetical protein